MENKDAKSIIPPKIFNIQRIQIIVIGDPSSDREDSFKKYESSNNNDTDDNSGSNHGNAEDDDDDDDKGNNENNDGKSIGFDFLVKSHLNIDTNVVNGAKKLS